MKSIFSRWMGTLTLAFMLCLTGLCVSGTAFAERCVDNGDGTVTDTQTNLMWQDGSIGRVDWYEAKNYVQKLGLGGHTDWRMPNNEEIQGLYHSPCLDVMSLKRDEYWSSTPYEPYEGAACLVSLIDGGAGATNKTNIVGYACGVRSAQ